MTEPTFQIIADKRTPPTLHTNAEEFRRLADPAGMRPATHDEVNALAGCLRPDFVVMAYERDGGKIRASILSVYDTDEAGNPTLRTLTRLIAGDDTAREYFCS